MAKRKGIPGVSFSAKRAVGVTRAKQSVSRKTGVPTTKSGRQRKAGAAGGCCLLPVLIFAGIVAGVLVILF